MADEYLEILLRLASAVVVGGLIGIERSYHGRPAGFRTHTLVCMASALLMLVTVYESQWFVSGRLERVVVDPTRMAQGIMTGIGFLGAGVIMKEGLSVRGLTSAASIWITAAIGLSLPNTAMAQELFNSCVANGGAKWDHSAMVRALERMANHEVA